MNLEKLKVKISVEPTQKEQVLSHLRINGFITNFDALNNYRICRLSAIIKDLRNEGYKIATLLQNGKVNKYGIYVLLAEPNQPKLSILAAQKNLQKLLDAQKNLQKLE